MEIIIDTREQRPLEFDNRVSTVKEKLDVGDYGARFRDGHVPPYFFERKSIGDLFGTMGKGYTRFKKEMKRVRDNNLQLFIIIEGTEFKVLKGTKYSKMQPGAVMKKLFTLWIRYNIIPIFCNNRQHMSEYITQFYMAVGREYVRGQK